MRHAVPLLIACLVALATGAAAQDILGPEDIQTRIADAAGADDYGADRLIVTDRTLVNVRPSGIGTARHQRVVKILTPAGIRAETVQRFDFDPYTNRLELEAVRVYRADGTVDDVSIANPAQQPQPAWGIFWGTQRYLVEVPHLAVGDSVETVTALTGFNVAYLADDAGAGGGAAAGERNALGEVLQPPVPGHWHDEADFWSSLPVLERIYSVRVPRDKALQFEVYNGELRTAVLLDGDELVYTFEQDHIAPLKTEPRMESAANFAPKLLLATLPTWQDKSKWLYEVSEPQFEADDAIRAKVAEVIKDCKTDAEKYTALNHWVAENIRYAGTSRGMCEGYTVHKSIETFHDRAGVCKDKAGMLVTMLRVAGFDSFLVMTMARQRVDRVPADQFNHAVTCIRWPDGSLTLLDPTWMPKSRDNWSTLEPLQHVVYGIPEGKELSQSPYFPPEVNAATWKGTSRVAADNSLRGLLTFDACGAPEGRIRSTLAGLRPEERTRFFDATAHRLAPDATLQVIDCTEPVDFSGPLHITAEYTAPQFALGQGSARYLKLPMLQTLFGDRAIYDLFETGLDQRMTGLRLLATRRVTIEETLALPAGWTVQDLPEDVDLDGPAASLYFSATSEPGQLKYTCQLDVKHWQIPADEYKQYKQVMDQFDALVNQIVVCDVEGAHASR